jgi:uncharacterized SAM-binding protein YcdF (DUF218 family)
VRRLLVLALLAVVALYAVGGTLFLGREDDQVRQADAVVVLAGSAKRLPVALDLVREGVAPVLVVSEDTTGRDPARTRLCRDGLEDSDVEILCRRADPYSTRGEARLVARLAEERHWRTIAIVSSRYHLFRAERMVERCTDADVAMRGAGESMGRNVVAVPLEWAKLALAETLRRGC